MEDEKILEGDSKSRRESSPSQFDEDTAIEEERLNLLPKMEDILQQLQLPVSDIKEVIEFVLRKIKTHEKQEHQKFLQKAKEITVIFFLGFFSEITSGLGKGS
jgi:hypothetical protein